MEENINIKKLDFAITIALVIATLISLILGGVVAYGISEDREGEIEQTRGVHHGPQEYYINVQEDDFDMESVPVNVSNRQHNTADNNNEDYESLGVFKVTAFTAGFESTGKTPEHPEYGITASGKHVKENHTIASDWDVLPPGSLVYIEDVGIRTVEDRGGGVKGNHIDLYIEELDKALEWGVKHKEVWIIDIQEEGADNEND